MITTHNTSPGPTAAQSHARVVRKAPNEASSAITEASKRPNTHPETVTAGSNPPRSHNAKIEKAQHRAGRSTAVKESGKSFPQGLSPGPPHRESSNNRYHCGFAQ